MYKDLDDFLVSRCRNKWIDVGDIKVYFRKSNRHWLCKFHRDEAPLKTLDIASVEADDPGNGAWTRFISSLKTNKKLLEYEQIYVENVLNVSFAQWFRRMGWVESCSYGASCFFKKVSDFKEQAE